MGKEGAFLFPKFVEKRREAISWSLKVPGLWRNEVVDAHGGLARFNSLLEEGNGGIVFFTHPTKSDPFRVIKVLMDSCSAIANREFVIPVAHHQHVVALNYAGGFLGVDTSYTVVTPHTMDRGKNKLHPTQKIPLFRDVFVSGVQSGIKFWDKEKKEKFQDTKKKLTKRNTPLHQGWGLSAYREATLQGVRSGEKVAVVAAQGGRSNELGSPGPLNAVDLLLNKLNKPGDETIAVAFVGTNPRNPRPKKDHTFTRAISSLEFNETLTMGEIRERAAAEKMTNGEYVFKKLAEVSRTEYVTGLPAAA